MKYKNDIKGNETMWIHTKIYILSDIFISEVIKL